jgi:hypothetical protein
VAIGVEVGMLVTVGGMIAVGARVSVGSAPVGVADGSSDWHAEARSAIHMKQKRNRIFI